MLPATLEPKVTSCQELFVPVNVRILRRMDERESFSRRLNELCDEMGVPPKGENRQAVLGKLFGVSQKGARKWLEGEGFPGHAKQINIAKWANVNSEWLRSGRGAKRTATAPPRPALERLMHVAEHHPDDHLDLAGKFLTTLGEPAPYDRTEGASHPRPPKTKRSG
jgi:transcriptional regulator with XRE-family HTH domain